MVGGNPITTPDAPIIEIVEKNHTTKGKTGAATIIVPNDVRINGQSILCGDDPVIVHEINTTDRDILRVTLTVIARRIIIGAENDE